MPAATCCIAASNRTPLPPKVGMCAHGPLICRQGRTCSRCSHLRHSRGCTQAIGYGFGGYMCSAIDPAQVGFEGWRAAFAVEGLAMVPVALLCFLVTNRLKAQEQERGAAGPGRTGDSEEGVAIRGGVRARDVPTENQSCMQMCTDAWRLVWDILSNGVWLCTTLGYAGYTFSVGAMAGVCVRRVCVRVCACVRACTYHRHHIHSCSLQQSLLASMACVNACTYHVPPSLPAPFPFAGFAPLPRCWCLSRSSSVCGGAPFRRARAQFAQYSYLTCVCVCVRARAHVNENVRVHAGSSVGAVIPSTAIWGRSRGGGPHVRRRVCHHR